MLEHCGSWTSWSWLGLNLNFKMLLIFMWCYFAICIDARSCFEYPFLFASCLVMFFFCEDMSYDVRHKARRSMFSNFFFKKNMMFSNWCTRIRGMTARKLRGDILESLLCSSTDGAICKHILPYWHTPAHLTSWLTRSTGNWEPTPQKSNKIK